MYVSLADVLSLYQSLFRQYLTAENVISLITISNSYSKIKTEETLRTRMWADAGVMAVLPNIGGALCQYRRTQNFDAK